MGIRGRLETLLNKHPLMFALKQHLDMLPSRVSPDPSKKSWSQHGEDEILVRELTDVLQTGFYMDIGANHPTKLSNTFRLYSLGMRGITVEPDSVLMGLHTKYRRGDISVCAASGAKDGLARFYRLSVHALSTFSKPSARKAVEQGKTIISESLVPVFTVKTILDNCAFENRHEFALLSVDVEDMDAIVLHSNDWGKYRPRLIVFEQNEEAKGEEIQEFLRSIGYTWVASPGCNQIWKLSTNANSAPTAQ